MNSFYLKATLWPLCLFVFFVVGCEKDALRRNEEFQTGVPAATKPVTPLSVQDAKSFFDANRPAEGLIASSQVSFVKLEPVWETAKIDTTLSGREVMTVALEDQLLSNLNGGRAGAVLMFSRANQDTISADVLVYFADSAYYAQNNGVIQFANFTGHYLFLDLTQQFEFGIAMRNGVPIGPVTDLQSQLVTVADDREGGFDLDDCIEREAYVWVPCNAMALEECNIYLTIIYYECDPSPGGSGGGYGNGNGNTTGGGGGGGGLVLTTEEQQQWNFIKYLIETGQLNFYGAFHLGVPVHIFVYYGGQIPPGLDVQEYTQLVQLHELCQFNEAQFNWVSQHASLIPYMTTLLAQHGNAPAWIDALKDVIDARIGGTNLFSWANMAKLVELQVKLELSEAELRWLIENQTFIDELLEFNISHSQDENSENIAVAVSHAYLNIKMDPDADLQEFIDDFDNWSTGDPLWDIILEQLEISLEEALIDIIPGGTAVTLGPQAIEHFQNEEWLKGMWTIIEITLDESSSFLPIAKAGKLSLNLYNQAKLLKKVYKVFKEAKQVGDDFVLKLYSTLRTKMGVSEIKNKFQWLGGSDGAKLDGESAHGFFEVLKSTFGATLAFNDVEYNNRPTFKIGERNNMSILMQLYPDSNTGWAWNIGFYLGPSGISTVKQLSPVYKIRFDLQ